MPQARLRGIFQGHEPRSIELAGAPLLEKWRVNLVCECTETPSLVLLNNAMSLTGRVIGHPELADPEQIETAMLVWLDRDGE